MKLRKNIIRMTSATLSAVLVGLGVFCVGERLPHYSDGSDAVLMAASLTMSKGGSEEYKEPAKKKKSASPSKKTEQKETEPEASSEPSSSDFDSGYYNTFADHSGYEKHPVYTQQYTAGGTKYENFYVKNNTDFDLNIGYSLNAPLGFEFEDTSDVQVLIYHTHTSESYLDCDVGYYYTDFYPRTSDNRYNVTRVGEAIAEQLRKRGIGVIHDTTSHDSTYTGSYYRSEATVYSYIKKYPSIKVTLDIHRDSIGDDTYKVKPTFTYNGKNGAQIMIMSGYDPTGELGFPDWNYNLRFALRLQKKCETKYSGMTRPLDFGEFVYNMNINTGSLLIEVGTDSNTLDEAVYSGKLLGKALGELLQNSG